MIDNILEFNNALIRLKWKHLDLSYDQLRINCDRFIGLGMYNRLIYKVISIEKSLSKVNTEDIYDRFYDIWDRLRDYEGHKSVFKAVTYKSYYEDKWTGFMTVENFDRKFILAELMLSIMQPTLSRRVTQEEISVEDSKYNCVNFKRYEHLYKSATFDYFRDKCLEKYSINAVLDSFVPSVVIYIDLEYNNYNTFSSKWFENEADEILKYEVLPNLDYYSVIWRYSEDGKFKIDRNITDYSIKILLN